MRNFDVSGLDRNVLEQTYEINLVMKLVQEAKLERIKKEMAVAACAIEDGTVDLNQVKDGLMNLIAYLECKASLPDEYDPDMGALDLVNKHLEAIKAHTKKRNKKA